MSMPTVEFADKTTPVTAYILFCFASLVLGFIFYPNMHTAAHDLVYGLAYFALYVSIPVMVFFRIVKTQWERLLLVVIFSLMSVPICCIFGLIFWTISQPDAIAARTFRKVVAHPSARLEIEKVEFSRPWQGLLRDKAELAMMKTALNHAQRIGLNIDLMQALDLAPGPTMTLKISDGVVLEIRSKISKKEKNTILIDTLQFDDDSTYYLVRLPEEIAVRFEPIR